MSDMIYCSNCQSQYPSTAYHACKNYLQSTLESLAAQVEELKLEVENISNAYSFHLGAYHAPAQTAAQQTATHKENVSVGPTAYCPDCGWCVPTETRGNVHWANERWRHIVCPTGAVTLEPQPISQLRQDLESVVDENTTLRQQLADQREVTRVALEERDNALKHIDELQAKLWQKPFDEANKYMIDYMTLLAKNRTLMEFHACFRLREKYNVVIYEDGANYAEFKQEVTAKWLAARET